MQAATLPPLREDLRLHEAAAGKDGAPAWSIQDPVTNRFFRIGWLEFECLLRWPGDPEQIARDIAATTPLAADKALVEDFARFLDHVPGCFAYVGNGEGSAPLRNPSYDFDDRGLIKSRLTRSRDVRVRDLAALLDHCATEQ